MHMPMIVAQIADEALASPSEQPALLADRLVESLDTGMASRIDRLWSVEAKRRLVEVGQGQVKTIPGDEALARVRRSLGRWGMSSIPRRSKNTKLPATTALGDSQAWNCASSFALRRPSDISFKTRIAGASSTRKCEVASPEFFRLASSTPSRLILPLLSQLAIAAENRTTGNTESPNKTGSSEPRGSVSVPSRAWVARGR